MTDELNRRLEVQSIYPRAFLPCPSCMNDSGHCELCIDSGQVTRRTAEMFMEELVEDQLKEEARAA